MVTRGIPSVKTSTDDDQKSHQKKFEEGLQRPSIDMDTFTSLTTWDIMVQYLSGRMDEQTNERTIAVDRQTDSPNNIMSLPSLTRHVALSVSRQVNKLSYLLTAPDHRAIESWLHTSISSSARSKLFLSMWLWSVFFISSYNYNQHVPSQPYQWQPKCTISTLSMTTNTYHLNRLNDNQHVPSQPSQSQPTRTISTVSMTTNTYHLNRISCHFSLSLFVHAYNMLDWVYTMSAHVHMFMASNQHCRWTTGKPLTILLSPVFL